MDRKQFFKNGMRDLASDLYKSPLGKMLDRQLSGVANLLDPQGLETYISDAQFKEQSVNTAKRPPGALEDEQDFKAACTECMQCIEACPYGVLYEQSNHTGPWLNPNTMACHLCSDYPCIAACDDQALLPLQYTKYPDFGQVRLEFHKCVNHDVNKHQRRRDKAGRTRKCTECKKACPVKGVVSYNKENVPQFTADCVGCGLCVSACPAYSVALQVELH